MMLLLHLLAGLLTAAGLVAASCSAFALGMGWLVPRLARRLASPQIAQDLSVIGASPRARASLRLALWLGLAGYVAGLAVQVAAGLPILEHYEVLWPMWLSQACGPVLFLGLYVWPRRRR